MIKIQNKDLDKLANEHYDLLCTKFSFSISKRIKASLDKYKKTQKPIYKKYFTLLSYIDENLKEIIISKPILLEQFKEELTKKSEDFEFYKKSEEKTEEQKEVLKDLNLIFNYDTFSSTGFTKAKTKNNKGYFYSGNVLVNNLKVFICPYCNRNTIYMINNNENRTSQIDHFYPKSIYPFFALSFYNLVPSCAICNKIKLDNDDKEYINPYDDRFDMNKNMKFSLKVTKSTFYHSVNGFNLDYKYSKDISKNEKDRIEANLNDFELNELYQNHKDIVLELIQKNEIYNESYLDELMGYYEGTLFKNREDLLRLVTCGYVSDEDINKRPLSKLIKDISNELDLI